MSKESLSSSSSVSRIIPKEESSEFQTWSVPQVTTKEDDELAEMANMPMLTAEQLEEIQQQAYQEGFQEGQQAGYDEGFTRGTQDGQAEGHKQALDSSLEEIQQQAFHFEQMFKSLEQPFSQMSEQVEYEVVVLAMAIAKQIISEEIKTQSENLVPLVKKTLHLLPSYAKRVKIFLHPEDLTLVKNAFELSDELDIEGYHLHEDVNLKRGGCIVDTDISHIDASLDKRIADIAESLLPQAPDLPTGVTFTQENDDSIQADEQELADQVEGVGKTEILPETSTDLSPHEKIPQTTPETIQDANDEMENNSSNIEQPQEPSPS